MLRRVGVGFPCQWALEHVRCVDLRVEGKSRCATSPRRLQRGKRSSISAGVHRTSTKRPTRCSRRSPVCVGTELGTTGAALGELDGQIAQRRATAPPGPPRRPLRRHPQPRATPNTSPTGMPNASALATPGTGTGAWRVQPEDGAPAAASITVTSSAPASSVPRSASPRRPPRFPRNLQLHRARRLIRRRDQSSRLTVASVGPAARAMSRFHAAPRRPCSDCRHHPALLTQPGCCPRSSVSSASFSSKRRASTRELVGLRHLDPFGRRVVGFLRRRTCRAATTTTVGRRRHPTPATRCGTHVGLAVARSQLRQSGSYLRYCGGVGWQGVRPRRTNGLCRTAATPVPLSPPPGPGAFRLPEPRPLHPGVGRSEEHQRR